MNFSRSVLFHTNTIVCLICFDQDFTWVDRSDLSAKSNFISLKAEVDKLSINKLVNVPTSLNSLKKLDDSNLKTVPADLKRLGNVVDNEVVKDAKFNTLKIKKKKNTNATTLIHLNQYNTDKHSLEKINGEVDKAYQIQVV